MADLAVEQGPPMASHDAAPEFAQNVFLVVWRDGGDDDPLMVAHRRGKFCQGRKIGRRLEDSADLSTSDCLEFYGPGSKQARTGATDAGGTTKPGLWCITAVFRQWDDGENIEQAISLTKGGPAPKWRRMDRVELAAFAKGGVSKKIEAWLLGPTQALWDGSLTGDYLLAAAAAADAPEPEPEPHVCTGCIGDGPCEAEHEEPSVSVVDENSDDLPEDGADPRLDYSKPPPGYRLLSGGDRYWWGSDAAWLDNTAGRTEAIASAWFHYKTNHDPPGMAVQWFQGRAGGEWTASNAERLVYTCRHERREEGRFEVRAAAWNWHDTRLALSGRETDAQVLATIRDGVAPVGGWWPRCLIWSDKQVAEVERWLVDSTAEMPEVLRG